MATEVVMPQMGESIAEGTITKWLVKEGDEVERDQPLFEISTDKVDAEIPSPADGVLLEIQHSEGETVAVDAVVALIGEAGEAAAAPEGSQAEEPQEEGAAESEGEDGEKLEAVPPTEAEEEEGAEEEEPATAEAEAPVSSEAAEGEPEAAPELVERIRRHSSPVVRKIAAEHDVDIPSLEGSGVHGRVTKADILAHLEEREAAPEAAAEPGAPVAAAAPSGPRREPGEFHVPAYTEGEDVRIEPMSKIRQITAAHMIYSKATSAHVTTVFEMDFSGVHAVRERAKRGFAEANDTKLTYMPFIFKAVCSALRACPKLNAAIDGTDVVFKQGIHLGMAVAMERGLIVPVIRHADRLGLVGLAETANDLAERARSKKLNPDEVTGGTFTITNPGVFGSLFGTPIINQPQVGILGIGMIQKRPVVETDQNGYDTIVIKPMSYFGISYDHRLVDGADADEFMNHIKRTLIEESWSELDPYV